jgi:putative adhesin
MVFKGERIVQMRLIPVALLAAALPFTVLAEDFHWQGRLAPGQTVEIKGVNGSIRAELATGSEIAVDATKSGHRSDPNSVRVETVPHAGGVTICAVYPSDDRPNECKPGNAGRMNTRNNDVKVDFVVKVPIGVKLTANTVNGNVEATNLRSDVDANTVNGKINISTAEQAEAKTVNGSIVASMGRMDSNQPLHFETVNGSVEVSMPANASADVHASTVNGGISTDFPLTVTGKFGPKSVTGKIGGGGRELKVVTVNGGISLKRI